MNSFSLLDVFSLNEAVQAVTSIFKPKTDEELATVKLVSGQLQADIHATKLPADIIKTPHYRRVGMRHIRMDDDTDHRPEVFSHEVTTYRIARADLLAWCESKGVRPPLLFPEPPPADKRLHDKERETLLGIVRALAELHGIKPDSDAYRKEAEALLTKLASKGITPPSNEKTLAKHLSAAFKAR